MTTISRLIVIAFFMAGVFFLVSCAGVGKSSSKASVEVSPVAVAASADIKLTGKSFQAEEEIDILFVLDETMKIGIGTAKVDVIRTDKSGNFLVEAAVPMNAKPGKYRIEIIGNKDSRAVTSVEVIKK